MKHYLSRILLIAVPLLISCENDESDAPILKGTVKGNIDKITDGYGYEIQDQSEVIVEISGDSYSADTTTDINGNFRFENVPFGSYHLTCIKENFVEQTGHYTFGHIGGEVATTVSQNLLGIPDFGFIIDSMEQVTRCYLRAHIRTYDASQNLADDYALTLLIFGDTPDVNIDNFDSYAIDYGYLYSGNEWTVSYYTCHNSVSAFSDFTGDSVYCRIYRLPFYKGYSEQEMISLPKGKPSNVFAFKNNRYL